jgi:hypothetical protein
MAFIPELRLDYLKGRRASFRTTSEQQRGGSPLLPDQDILSSNLAVAIKSILFHLFCFRSRGQRSFFAFGAFLNSTVTSSPAGSFLDPVRPKFKSR